MNIKSVRLASNMSQWEFSKHFGIPIGTLRNWEQGISNPPSYVFKMIAAQTKRDCMINLETLEFIKIAEELAEKSKNGIEPFANATAENFDSKLFFDANEKSDNGCRVVCDTCLACDHHDIISYYGNHEYDVWAKQDEDGKWFILIVFNHDDAQIVIEDGKWYFV